MLEEIDFMFCRITMFLDEHYSWTSMTEMKVAILLNANDFSEFC